jgi:tRNA G37 N-methylase Trm5
METEKIIKAEHEEEIRTIFRKLIASGVLDSDKAITKIMRDYPHFFREPTADEVKKISHSTMNEQIRSRSRSQQSNKPTYDIFANVLPTDKKPI